ncbi:hypothetical protein [Streptomyces sp. NPDC059708]|uniref:hypothetical protein n=1 Tax=Streptomyces sp. NPDC059708 TaxID=3346916 RepID=UPI0036C91F5E
MAIEPPNELLELERVAWTEIQEGRLTIETVAAVQTAITEYATEHGLNRYELEKAVKTAVRHPKPSAGG